MHVSNTFVLSIVLLAMEESKKNRFNAFPKETKEKLVVRKYILQKRMRIVIQVRDVVIPTSETESQWE